MGFILHLLFGLFSIVLFFCGDMIRSLILTILKAIIAVGTMTPGFQSYLGRQIDSKVIRTDGTISVIKTLARGTITSALLRQIKGLDILVVTTEGRFYSLLHDKYSSMGVDPTNSEISLKFAVLLLGEDTPSLPIRFNGPILLSTKAQIPEIHGNSLVMLDGSGEINASKIHVPLLIHDIYTSPQNLDPETTPVGLSDLLNLTRVPMLKLLRGESLIEPDIDLVLNEPEPRSLFKLLREKAKISRGKWFIGADWTLTPADLQIIVDQKMGRAESRVRSKIPAGPVATQIEILNPQISTMGKEAELKFDMSLEVTDGPNVVQKAFNHPVLIRDVVVRVKKFEFNPFLKSIELGQFEIVNLNSSYLDHPGARAMVLKLTSAALNRRLGPGIQFDLRNIRTFGLPLVSWLIRRIELREGNLHVRAGVGFCGDWLTAPIK